MGLNPFSIQQAQERLAVIHARSRLRSMSGVGNPEQNTPEGQACALGQEIKGLHDPFIQWCNLHQILYDRARSDKRSTVAKGRADFLLLKNGCGCAIEFKALDNVEGGLSEDQKEWISWANRSNVPTLVTNSLAEAIKFATRELECG